MTESSILPVTHELITELRLHDLHVEADSLLKEYHRNKRLSLEQDRKEMLRIKSKIRKHLKRIIEEEGT